MDTSGGQASDYYMTLTREHYISQEWFDRDIARVFSRSWLLAGYASQISRPGDFFTFELADTSVVVTRTETGEVAAFHNVCRHRGTRFCAERSGHVKRAFVCRFHGWAYGLDGTLRAAPQMPGDFDRERWPAKPVAVDVWNGLVFINLAQGEITPVSHILRNVDVGIYDLEHTKVAADIELTWPCNWKLISEAFQECYHCRINHPELCQVLIPDSNFDGLQAKPVTDDDDGEFLIFTADRSYAIREGMKTFSLDGDYLVKRLLGSPGNPPTRIAQVDWFPNFQAFLQPDFTHVETFLPVSPIKSVFRASFLVHEDAVEGVDYDVHELTHMYVKTLEQDGALVEAAQRGVSSPAHQPGPFHPVLESAAIEYFKRYERAVRAH
jgi:Rieske 2Fe-2S family protein